MRSATVVVEPYDSRWVSQFEEIKNALWPFFKDLALSIEHVGSTSVPGLAAKPILDIDIVIPDGSLMLETIARLSERGYEHRGNLGIQDREAFRAINPRYRHNLYVCPRESMGLRNHLCLRDALRAKPELRDAYATLKYRLAAEFPNSIDDYIEGKTTFILRILEANGQAPEHLEAIRIANLAPKKT